MHSPKKARLHVVNVHLCRFILCSLKGKTFYSCKGGEIEISVSFCLSSLSLEKVLYYRHRLRIKGCNCNLTVTFLIANMHKVYSTHLMVCVL